MEKFGQRRQVSDSVAHLQEPAEKGSTPVSVLQIFFSQMAHQITSVGPSLLDQGQSTEPLDTAS